MIAYILAAQNDPGKHLCPHPLRFSLDRLRIPLYVMVGRELSPTSANRPDTSEDPEKQASQAALQDYWKKLVKPDKKDRRSLTQNIFDTSAVKFFESAFFNTPVELFVTLFYRKRLPHHANAVPERKDREKENLAVDTMPNEHTNGSIEAPESHHLKQNGGINNYGATPPQTPPVSTIANGYTAPKKQNNQAHTHIKFAGDENTVGQDSPTKQQLHSNQQDNVSSDSADSSLTAKFPDPSIRIWPPEYGFQSLLLATRTGQKTQIRLNLPISVPLTVPAMDGLRSMMRFCSNDMDVVYDHFHRYPSNGVYKDVKMKHRIQAYVKRSLYVNFSSIPALLRCFTEIASTVQDPDDGVKVMKAVFDVFRGWTPLVGSLIFDALWEALEPLFNLPDELLVAKAELQQDSDPSKSSKITHGPHFTDSEALHTVLICVIALVAAITHGDVRSRFYIGVTRSFGWFAETSTDFWLDPIQHSWVQISDDFEYEPAIRLMDRLVRVIGARRCHFALLNSEIREGQDDKSPRDPLMMALIRQIIILNAGFEGSSEQPNDSISTSPAALFLERLQTIVTHNWDGETVIDRWGSCGTALEIMSDLYEFREALRLPSDQFYLPFVTRRLDPKAVASQYLQDPLDEENIDRFGELNILDFTFITLPRFVTLVFRMINFDRLVNAYGESNFNQMMIERLPFAIDPSNQTFVQSKLKPALSKFLVLDIRRDHLLEDAFDQLWGREHRELLRPLKVKIGSREGEGEEGVDHGGVSQEFFRLIWAQAFDPDMGLFDTDETTRMSWFQPCSTEPRQTYELFGMLVGLAIYNGVTLPVTFPLALYRKLLGKPVKSITHIRDGWPSVAKSFEAMLAWKDDDVEDIFGLDYAFTFESAGKTYTIDMHNPTAAAWVKSGGDIRSFIAEFEDDGPPPLVTNANRVRFVEDFIAWRTDYSITREFAAFAKGFHTILPSVSPHSPSPLSLLSAELLRSITEGYPDFAVEDLRRITRYEDGYHASHPLIQHFWTIVENYDTTQRRRLLEFVTASDRVPVGGVGSVTFVILRAGADSERVPTSMTCYGRLMIPEYDCRDGGAKLEAKLRIALENTVGFGHV